MVITSELTRELKTLEELVIDFILSKSAKGQYRLGKVAKSELTPYIELLKDLSNRYVGIKSVELSHQQVAAYALYYLPINFAKLAFILQQNISFESNSSIRVLDFGCGPGTGALASAFSFTQPLEISLSDTSRNCLSFAEKLISSYRNDVSVETKHLLSSQKQQSPKESKLYDLIIAANVLSELPEETLQPSLQQLLKQVKENGYLVILAPALKTTTQLLMSIRNLVLETYLDFSVIFPCVIQTTCPLSLENNDDWCHGELDHNFWERPPLLKQLDEELGFNKHRVKYSVVVFQRKKIEKLSGYRVLRPSSKSHPALLCGEHGLIRISARQAKDPTLRRALKNGNSYELIDSDLLSNIKK